MDPCDPEPGEECPEREWRIRKLTRMGLGRISPSEYPERIVAGCTPDDESEYIVATWLTNRRLIA